ncbi:RRP12 isoform X2 [Brachionus plicatilis]|uniref:RRP12 isoform X2 n=1 Tax=Brachionus plicatilis TaxID=10195 RepID=A0A3M7RUT2_BRAPC|nr:RRP12 isoform X2 [Brachionus plicatilis]
MVKGKRWKKGQSSSSNPETKKYREIAKNNRSFFNFGHSSTNPSQLTEKALAQLDSMSIENDNFDNKSIISDAESADTFRSWASNWSECTNATFNRVHRYWRSNSALHKEILAVLAAVTEVIKENDGKESETEYLAALMTGMESVDENEESTAAFLYLIALSIKKVPENVLRAKYADLMNSFVNKLDKYGAQANNVTLIKSCLMCLCWLLKSQDQSIWENDKTVKCYLQILSFVTHDKPKVRKCGQEAVRLIMNSVSSTQSKNVHRSIGSVTADYCLTVIKTANEESEAAKANKTTKKSDANQTVLHILSLFKYTIHHFDLKQLKSIGECLFGLMISKDLMIISNCYQIFYQLFTSQVNSLNFDLNAQMINAFYDFEPSENDPQQIIGWLAVMETAIKSLNRLNKALCLTHLPRIFQTFMSILSSSHNKKVHVVVTNCLCSLLEQSVQTNIELFVEDMHKQSDLAKALLHKIFSHVEAGLSYQYHMSWIFVMKILASTFTCFKNRETFPIVEKCLSSLANLRESEQFDFKKEADIAIGKAVQTYGPKLVIDSIDLKITGEETSFEYPRSWMLPLLKDYIERTEISFFITDILPLANKIRVRHESAKKNNKMMEAKIFDTLHNQLWALLPGFCDFALDFDTSFKNIAKTLGEILEKYMDLRCHVLQALRTAIIRNTEPNKSLMGKYAKNYLPIMFNIYTTEIRLDKDPSRQSLIDTIKFYLKITDYELINSYLIQAIKNYHLQSKNHEESIKSKDMNNNKPESEAKSKVVFDFKAVNKQSVESLRAEPFLFAKHSFLDLIAVLAKYSNFQNVQTIFDMCIQAIGDKQIDKTTQKKFYKILDSLLTSGKLSSEKQNENVLKFVQNEFEMFGKIFVKSLGDCNSAAKVPRLKCMIHLLDYVQRPEEKMFLKQILPEIILSIREINHKSREAAFHLLNSMLKLWQKLGLESQPPITETDSLNEFFHLVMVGLAGSTNMISCTCFALSSLSFEFRENISGSLIKDLIDTSCLLIRSENKETVLASLNLLKIMCSAFQAPTLGQYLDQICDSIHHLHEKRAVTQSDNKNAANQFAGTAPINKSQRIKTLVKLTLKKLMKKFSYEILHEKIFKNECRTKQMDMDMDEKTRMVHLTGALRQGLENLLANLKKTIEKERKKRLEDEKASKKGGKSAQLDLVSIYTTNTHKTMGTNINEIEDLLKESDSEGEEKMEDGKSVKSAKTNKTSKSVKRAEKKSRFKEDKNAMAWLQENDNEDPLDLLDPMAIKRVLSTKPLTKQEIEKKKEREFKSKNRGFKMSNDGKLMIDDSDEDDSDVDRQKVKFKKNKQPDQLEEMMDTLSLSKKSVALSKKSNKKRMIGDEDDSDAEDARSKFSYKSGGKGIHRKTDKSVKIPDHGSEYRARKAGGDVKLKNKPDPFAYIPFNPAKLNRRNKAKLQGEFKGVIRSVQKGAQKGSKKFKKS